MKITVLIDSFKGSLSSLETGNIVKETILKINKDEQINVLPIADGGEGTVEALSELEGAREITVKVNNPLMDKIDAKYIIVDNKKISEVPLAIMEMSAASGLTLIKDNLSPMTASTYGVGEMIIDAVEKGVKKFIIGIGGSATNDGGIGMLTSLGYKFLDEDGNAVHPSVKGIEYLEKIDTSNVDTRLKDCEFSIACDVDNPLTGEKGSANVFGPQKGANEEQVIEIDRLLGKFHVKTKEIITDADDKYPGVGAAGGLGYAFKNYFKAELTPGIELILNLLNAEELIKESDLVITGEGKIDFQTSMGKTPVGIARTAKKYNKKVIAFSGIVDNEAVAVNKEGIDAFFPILDKITSLEEAMDKEKAKENLSRCVSQVFNLIYLYR